MISAASPIWTAIMARFILKEMLSPFAFTSLSPSIRLQEPLGILDVFNVVLTILGLVFIIRPPFIYGYDAGWQDHRLQEHIYFNDSDHVVDSQYYIAAVAVFASTFLQAAIYIFLR